MQSLQKLSINIAGAFTFNFTEFFLKSAIYKKFNITVYDGVNNCQWNGGRINRPIYIDQKDIERYNKLGIAVSLTFSNHIIDLNDDTGQTLLKWLNDSQIKYGIQNEITLVNEDFLKHLRSNYNFILKYSITGHDSKQKNVEELKVYYKRLELLYDKIVPKMEDVFKNVFSNNNKYELMLNDTCLENCPYYNEHFKAINFINKNTLIDINNLYNDNKSIEECWLSNFDPNIPNMNNNCGMDFNESMFKESLSKGFNSFKISGRENKQEDILNDIKYYIRIYDAIEK